jgi:hypothetical protein
MHLRADCLLHLHVFTQIVHGNVLPIDRISSINWQHFTSEWPASATVVMILEGKSHPSKKRQKADGRYKIQGITVFIEASPSRVLRDGEGDLQCKLRPRWKIRRKNAKIRNVNLQFPAKREPQKRRVQQNDGRSHKPTKNRRERAVRKLAHF